MLQKLQYCSPEVVLLFKLLDPAECQKDFRATGNCGTLFDFRFAGTKADDALISGSCWFSLLGLIQGSWEVQTLQGKKKNKKGSLPLSSPVSSVETFTGYVLDSSPVVSTWVEMYREEESVSPNPKGAHRCAEEKNYNSAWRFSCAQVPGVPGRSTEHLEYDSHALTFYPELAALSSPCYF